MANYTCLLLDLDNTILDFNAAERKALTDTLRQYELPNDENALDAYHKMNSALWGRLAKGELTQSKLFDLRFADFMRIMGMPDNGKGREINDYYEAQLALHPDTVPGALNALNELAEVATLAVLTNGAVKVQESRIEASGIDKFMDGIYISEKVGYSKPAAKIFDHALRDLGITDRSRVLVIGDDLRADIKGGLNAGLDTCWVNFEAAENNTDVKPKYVVQSFEELYKIVMDSEELDNIGMWNRRHINEGV